MKHKDFNLRDQLRIIMLQQPPPVPRQYPEHRYEQRGAEYTLRSWRDKEMTITASMVEQPDWLTKIINMALVGGYTHPIPNPPPNMIVWFRTEPDSNDLHEFINFADSRTSE